MDVDGWMDGWMDGCKNKLLQPPGSHWMDGWIRLAGWQIAARKLEVMQEQAPPAETSQNKGARRSCEQPFQASTQEER